MRSEKHKPGSPQEPASVESGSNELMTICSVSVMEMSRITLVPSYAKIPKPLTLLSSTMMSSPGAGTPPPGAPPLERDQQSAFDHTLFGSAQTIGASLR